MALPKNKSRIITIDQAKFRCMVGPNDGYNIFYAELDQAKRQMIHVYFDMYQSYYDGGAPIKEKSNLKILKPKDFETIIRQALEQGWNPIGGGTPMLFDLKGDILIKR